VTYFYNRDDSTSFIQTGRDPVVIGLRVSNLSCSLLNCFFLLWECLLYVHWSACYEAWRKFSVTFLQWKSCHVQWKKNPTHVNKTHNFNFNKVLLCQAHLLFPHFPPAQSEQCQYSVSSRAKRKESLRLWYKKQRVTKRLTFLVGALHWKSSQRPIHMDHLKFWWWG